MQRQLRAQSFVVAGVLAFAATVVGLGLLARSHTPPSDNPYLGDQLLIGSILVPAGGFVTWKRPGHRLGWLVMGVGVLYWVSFAAQPGITWLVLHRPGWEIFIRVLLALGISGWLVARGMLLALVPLCYPNAAPVDRLGRLLWGLGAAGIAVAAVAHSRLYTPGYFEGVSPTGSARLAEEVEPWAWRVVLVVSLVSIGSMVVRVARLGPGDRRRHAPVAATAAVLVVPVLSSFYGEFTGHDLVTWSEDVLVWTAVAFPCVLLYGVVRHGLLDVRVVVRRSTIYAVTALALAALYALVVWAATNATATYADTGRVLATGVVAVAAVPVHTRVRASLGHRLFGHRGDPAAVLAAIGTTVEQAPQGTAALDLVAATVQRELRLPFVAVDLHLAGPDGHENTRRVRVASAGDPTDEVEAFDLIGPEGSIGELVVARRTPREPFGRGEVAALRDIARHVAVLASNVALTQQLLASRSQLVTAREEERRRIRRDLHDGLGPTLASVCLGLGVASERIGDDSELGSFLRELEDELHFAVDEIRRLVYDLRPPALDELGLVGAVRDHVATLAARSGDTTPAMDLRVEGDQVAEHLPAAVEVAAYRIAMEAITNVTRHASARHCWVRFRTSPDALQLEVEDDGLGIGAAHRAGVGLRSMRDRAAELGGDVSVRSVDPRGTLVRASLPLAVAAGAMAT